MIQQRQPILFYPTTVVLVDDQPRFLNTLKEGLERRGLRCLAFTDAHEAIQYMNRLPRHNPFLNQARVEDNTYLSSASEVKVDLTELYQHARAIQKTEQVAVVVSDYDMPDIKGDELFGALSSRWVKKIMLTGDPDDKLAIELLNAKVIDNFTVKHPMKVVDELFKQVCHYQRRYFYDLLASTTQHLFSEDALILTPEYNALLEKVMAEYAIKEYYTLTLDGHKAMFTESGEQYWLVTATEDDMESWLETAELADTPDSIVQKLAQKSHLLFLFNPEEIEADSKEWEAYLHPATSTQIAGQTVYYAVVKTSTLT